MKNEKLLATREDFNPFTEEVKRRCQANGQCLVKLRDCSFRMILFRPASPEEKQKWEMHDEFQSHDFDSWWYPDGSNVTTNEWDMIEL